jgi:chemotaxis protein methyltransferase CheR
MSAHEFRLIREVINEHCGFWIPDGGERVLASKLARLQDAAQADSFHGYYQLIKYGDGRELDRAVEAIVNNETYFFREVAQLKAIVDLARNATSAKRAVRVLSAGCSTGEEPYSIAMLLDEAGVLEGDVRVEVHGIDISGRVLERARTAKYTSNSFRGAEGQYLDWYFKPAEGALKLDERLRRRVSFTQTNLLDTARLASLGMFDVVLCRNVIIYFDQGHKVRVVEALIRLVREGGHLFMGHSESLYTISNALEMVQVGDAIGYRRPVDSARAG